MVFFNETMALMARIIIGILLIVTGILKVPDLRGFFASVLQYRIIKGTFAKIFAYSLPFVEIIVGVALIIGYKPLISSGLALLMLLVSTIGIGIALYKSADIDNCGCYGTAVKVPINKKKLFEDIAWTIIITYAFVYYLLNII